MVAKAAGDHIICHHLVNWRLSSESAVGLVDRGRENGLPKLRIFFSGVREPFPGEQEGGLEVLE